MAHRSPKENDTNPPNKPDPADDVTLQTWHDASKAPPDDATERLEQSSEEVASSRPEVSPSYTFPLPDDNSRTLEPPPPGNQNGIDPTLPLPEEAEAPDTARKPPGKPPTTAKKQNLASDIGMGSQSRPWVEGYEILEEIGRGGMGVVYKARQTGLNRLVAIKMILAGSHAGSRDRERFQIEAEAVARLQHPNIIQIYEVGKQGDYPFIAFEYADGGSLSQRLSGAPLPEIQAAQLVEIVARAVHVAHQRDIIHRDLKPANILLSLCDPKLAQSRREGGTAELQLTREDVRAVMPKVSDFGLAKNLQTDSGQTASGDVMGTPSYMAPEQAAGRVKELGPAVDIYALGAILYELLVGKPPFRGQSSWETLKQVINEEPVSCRRIRPDVSRDLETICIRCLHKESSKRYPTALDLAEDLRRFQRREPIQARPVGLIERVIKWTRRRPAVAALLATLVVVVVGGCLALLGLYVRAEKGWNQAEKERKAAVKAQEQIAIEKGKVEAEKGKVDEARKEALKGKKEAEKLTKQVKKEYEKSRRSSYAAHIHEAQAAHREGNYSRAQQILSKWGESGEEEDLRGFEWHLLWHLCDKKKETAQHARLIHEVAFTRDVKLMVTASLDGSVKLWDLVTGSEGKLLGHHRGPVRAAVFHPNGSLLATAGEDRLIYLWDVQSGKKLCSLAGHEDWVVSLAFHPTKLELLSGSIDKSTRIWKLSTLLPPDGEQAIKVWNLGEEDPRVTSFRDHRYGVTTVAYSPDGTLIATGGLDKAIYLYEGDAEAAPKRLSGHSRPITGVAFSPDGKFLASTGADKVLRLWDVNRREQLHRFDLDERPVDVAFSPSGKELAILTANGIPRAWDLATKKERELNRDPKPLPTLAFHSDGRLLDSIQFDFQLGDHAFPIDEEHSGAIYSVSIDRASKLVATAGEDGRVLIHALKGRERDKALTGHEDPVYRVVFSPTEEKLASCSEDGTVRLWQSSGEVIRTLTLSDQWLYALAFSPDGKEIVSGGEGRSLTLWPINAEKPRLTIPGHQKAIRAVAFHPDPGQEQLASGDREGILKIWNSRTGKLVHSIETDQGQIRDLAYSPNGDRLATAGWHGNVKLWSPVDGRFLAELSGHSYGITCVVFTHNGKRLVTGSEDKTIKIWDVISARELATLQHHTGAVTDLVIDERDELLLSVGEDGAIAQWKAPRISGGR